MTKRNYLLMLTVALTLWGLRLGWYMRQRHRGQEDARYAAMRQNHGADFGRKSLWLVFWLQAVLQWLAASPILVAAFAKPQPVWPITALGLALFSAGFLLEILADRAVARFKSNPANRGKLLTSGLHARIRHPNYLGEIIEWCGWALATWTYAGFAFAFFTAANLLPRAISHHHWYRAKFPEYPRERKAILPGLL